MYNYIIYTIYIIISLCVPFWNNFPSPSRGPAEVRGPQLRRGAQQGSHGIDDRNVAVAQNRQHDENEGLGQGHGWKRMEVGKLMEVDGSWVWWGNFDDLL